MNVIGVAIMGLAIFSSCKTYGEYRCLKGNCSDGYGEQIVEMRWTREDGSRPYVLYKGEFLHGKRHGKGTLDLRATEGDFYEGDFANDRYHGYGKWHRLKTWPWPEDEISSCPMKYEGSFREGWPAGEGKLTTRDGKEYAGIFGNTQFKGGICYEGDCQNGKGAVIYWHGLHYRGEFKNGKPHGHGTQYDAMNRWRYTGEFKNGEYDGYGIEISYDIPRYTAQGTWINPKPTDRHEGMYVAGRAKGQGKCLFFNTGQVLEGNWDGGLCYDETGKLCKDKRKDDILSPVKK